MENRIHKSEITPFRWLILVYFAGVILRYGLGLIASQNPFVMPDEALYANIARSIVDGAGISLRNQPVTYTNILYPLLISPVYAVIGPGMQFRVIQLMNCLFMNLAVFPAFAIAKRFTANIKIAWAIALLSILAPDMLLTTRIMTEAIVYPLFLWTVYLMFQRFSRTRETGTAKAVLTAAAAYLLTQAKSGSLALAIVFFGILIYDFIRSRRRSELYYALVFAGVYAALMVFSRLALSWAGMDFSQPSIYATQTQMPTLDHLKKTLPGMLLYAFFIPVAFGIYPLLVPSANLKRFDAARQRQILLILISLVLYAAGACYLFFDTETIGNFFQGRIHIRYVFMFLPLFACFALSPALEGVRPNGKLLGWLGFLLAMTVTVSFGALLSGRQYPVDAILLSYVIYDDADLNWELLSQIAVITFAAVMLVMMRDKGWTRPVKRICIVFLALALAAANWLGYDLNRHNNSKALAEGARQSAQILTGEPALLVPDSDIYFDNTLSVLDIAMGEAPYFIKYDDLCAALGDYGALDPLTPPRYWTEKPAVEIPAVNQVVFTPSAFLRMVPARGVRQDKNGSYVIVSPGEDRRLFHSALAGLSYDGRPESDAALYLYDEDLLSRPVVRVYLKVSCSQMAAIALRTGTADYSYDLDESSEWIYGDFTVPPGCTVLRVAIAALTGAPVIETYRVETPAG